MTSDQFVEKTESDNFYYIMLAPVIVFTLGMVLLEITDTPWQLLAGSAAVDIFRGVFWGFSTFGGIIILTRMPVSESLRETCRELLPLFENMAIWQIVMISLGAGISEEIMFRGFLQQWLAGFYSIELAITIASVVFGLLHFLTFSYFLLTTFLGAAMGIAYYLTGSLLLVITWHAVYDLLVLWVFSQRPELLGLQ